jgi:hypothetical protein
LLKLRAERIAQALNDPLPARQTLFTKMLAIERRQAVDRLAREFGLVVHVIVAHALEDQDALLGGRGEFEQTMPASYWPVLPRLPQTMT